MDEQNPVEIVLAVPGNWLSRVEIVTAVARKSRGYRLAGDELINNETQECFEIEVAGHDPDLAEAFLMAAPDQLTPRDTAKLATHTCTLNVIGPGGTIEDARAIMDFGAALLRSGGIALRVESSGAVHSAEQWLNITRYKNDGPTVLFDAYVVLTTLGDVIYSCGMHNLGLRDGVITIRNTPDEALNVLQAFLLYLLDERPELREGTIFSTGLKTPRYRLKGEKCTAYPPGDLLYNPYGIWRLT